ncbi:hypothetical protein VTL71DRAFT_11370 [Oculimacula yallundae]|uniref:Fungal N-terminal domain-containing protein n=1 Tax=Oculimacula yallundae TaxID=86028 RepID=A0ABR4CQE5_9HELO
MDPLSITTACVSLGGTIGPLSLKINTFVREVRDARSDMEAVKKELGSLELVLGIVEDEFKQFESPGYKPALVKQVHGILASCGDILKDIEKTLEKFSRNRLRNKLKWAISGREDINKMRSYLQGHTAALDIVIEMIHLRLSQEIKQDTSAIRVELRTEASAIKNDTTQILAEIAILRSQLPVNADQIPNPHGIILGRYLDNLETYTESLADPNEDFDSALGLGDEEDLSSGLNRLEIGADSQGRYAQQSASPGSQVQTAPLPEPKFVKQLDLKMPGRRHGKTIWHLAFSADGKKLAAILNEQYRGSKSDDSVGIWDVATGVFLEEFKNADFFCDLKDLIRPENIYYVAFSPATNTMLAWASPFGVVLTRDSARETILRFPSDVWLAFHPTFKFTFSHDGLLLSALCISLDKTTQRIQTWDVETGACLYSLDSRSSSPGRVVDSWQPVNSWQPCSIAFSPDSCLLVVMLVKRRTDYSWPRDSWVVVWDLARRQKRSDIVLLATSIVGVVFRHTDNAWSTSFISRKLKRKSLIYLPIEKDEEIKLLDLATPEESWNKLRSNFAWSRPITRDGIRPGQETRFVWSGLLGDIISPDGRFITTTPRNRRDQARSTTMSIRETTAHTHKSVSCGTFDKNHCEFKFSPDSRVLASYNYEYKRIEIWKLATH